MFQSQLVIATLFVPSEQSQLALEKVGDQTRLHSVVELIRSNELADIVVVLTDSEDVLAAAYSAGTVNHFVSHTLNETQAITALFESDEVFVDEDDEAWVLRVSIDFDETAAEALKLAADSGSSAGLAPIAAFR
jgi:hypothetical protein